MAVIWQRRHNQQHYEVRTAGRSVRLYTNGVFHSQYNPAHIMSGGVWDLLCLPLLLRHQPSYQLNPQSNHQSNHHESHNESHNESRDTFDTHKNRSNSLPTNRTIRSESKKALSPIRVLVLGVGGGAVIRQIKHFYPDADIVGVDIDPVHLSIAKRFFGVTPAVASLHEADAKKWLQHYVKQGKGKLASERFDIVIDDLFGHHNGEALRAFPVDAEWSRTLLQACKKGGLIIVNFDSLASVKCCALSALAAMDYVAEFTTPLYENKIMAYQLSASPSLDYKKQRELFFNYMYQYPQLNPQNASCRLNYRLKKSIVKAPKLYEFR